jgi:hypothetical protein
MRVIITFIYTFVYGLISVDDRAKVVEIDLRLAMKQDQRKEAELTGRILF